MVSWIVNVNIAYYMLFNWLLQIHRLLIYIFLTESDTDLWPILITTIFQCKGNYRNQSSFAPNSIDLKIIFVFMIYIIKYVGIATIT